MEATIALAKILQTQQPELFRYAFQLRRKHQVKRVIENHHNQALLHISGRLPANQGHADLIYPITQDTKNPNKIYVISLHSDIDYLMQTGAEELKTQLFIKTDSSNQSEQRIRIKGIYLNRSPILATADILPQQRASALHIDIEQCRKNLHKIIQLSSHDKDELADKIQQIFIFPETEMQDQDVEQQLYSGTFLSDHDKRCLQQVHQTPTQELGIKNFAFQDQRLFTLLWRYQARNFPESLTTEQLKQWQTERLSRLTENKTYNLDNFCNDWANLYTTYKDDQDKYPILMGVKKYVKDLVKN